MANDREILETRGVVANGTSSWAAQGFKPSYGFDYMVTYKLKQFKKQLFSVFSFVLHDI